MHRTVFRLLLLAVAVALVGAACGGSDEGDAATTTSTTGAASDVSGADPDSDWCRLTLALDETNPLDEITFGDPESIRTAFDTFLGQIDEASRQAPDEIRDDVAVSKEAFEQLADALADVDYDFFALLDRPTVLELLDSPEVVEASNNIELYNERECGIPADLDDPESGSFTALIEAGGISELLVDEFVGMGLTQDEARCLVDNLDLAVFAGGGQDPAATQNLFDAFDACGIDMDRLGQIGEGDSGS